MTVIDGVTHIEDGFRLLFGNWVETMSFLRNMDGSIGFGMITAVIAGMIAQRGDRKLPEVTRL
jgi:hypothetical protein